MTAINNAFCVVDIATGQQLMHVVDANDPTDPAWNPPGSVQIDIPVEVFNDPVSVADVAAPMGKSLGARGSMSAPSAALDVAPHEALDAYIIQSGVDRGITIKTALSIAPLKSEPWTGLLPESLAAMVAK